MFNNMSYQQTALPRSYIDRGGEPINRPGNNGKSWNSKLIGRLLLTMTVTDPKQLTPKAKPVTYTRAFVELYNWSNSWQIHEIHRIIKLEKMHASTAENLCNLGAYWIIEISSVLHSAHVIPRNQDKFVFYVNNYIDWGQFNQLYDLD